MTKVKERTMHIVFLVAACMSILAVAMICLFMFANGVPAIRQIGFVNFIFGKTWMPGANKFGIFPMIIGSIYVTQAAEKVLIEKKANRATTFFIFLALFTTMLAGIPSIVYGFFGLVVITPMIRNTFGGSGKNILTACILLGIMILPTIISVSESAIRAVPESYYEGALALGDTHERSVFKAVLPAAKSGILAAIILGIGRAIGETMAVIMIAGNHAVMPDSLLAGVRTLTSNIVLELGYATDLHREALIATGVVLFVFILIINLLFSVVKKKGAK